jgi:hypothetical protein
MRRLWVCLALLYLIRAPVAITSKRPPKHFHNESELAKLLSFVY